MIIQTITNNATCSQTVDTYLVITFGRLPCAAGGLKPFALLTDWSTYADDDCLCNPESQLSGTSVWPSLHLFSETISY